MGCHDLLQGSSQPRDQTHDSHLLHWWAGSVPLVRPGKPNKTGSRQKAYCTTGILCPVEGAGGGGTSSESARVSPAGTQLGLQGPRAGEGGLTQERSSVWGQSVEPPWGLQWPQGCCCGQDPTTSWLKSQLLFSRKTSPLGGQAHVFSVCTQGRDLELGVCSSSCKDTSPAESGPPS